MHLIDTVSARHVTVTNQELARPGQLQRDRRVGELAHVDGLTAADKLPDRISDVPDVDVHAGQRRGRRPSQKARTRRRLQSPRNTTASYPPGATHPEYSMPRSYWSVKKYGGRS